MRSWAKSRAVAAVPRRSSASSRWRRSSAARNFPRKSVDRTATGKRNLRRESTQRVGVGCQATGRHNAVQVGMEAQVTGPGVEHRGDAAQRAEALGVAAEFEEGLRGGSKQDVEEPPVPIICEATSSITGAGAGTKPSNTPF